MKSKQLVLSDNARQRFERIGWDTTPSGCWEWRGTRNTATETGVGGYGRFYCGGPRQSGKRALSHRVAYALYKGDPGTRLVLHTCDNPPCVNPDHLSLGAQVENMEEMRLRNRRTWAVKYPDELLVRALVTSRREGLTARQVEERFGIGRHHFSGIRTGRSRPHIRSLALAEYAA